MILDLLAAAFMVLGALACLASAIGVVRFTDPQARAHALGVAATVGILAMMLGVTFALRDLAAGAKAGLTVLFILITSPVGSHMIGRAAYTSRAAPRDLRRNDLLHQDQEIDPGRRDG